MKQPLCNLAHPTRLVGDFRPPDASGRRFPSSRRVWSANFRTSLLLVLCNRRLARKFAPGAPPPQKPRPPSAFPAPPSDSLGTCIPKEDQLSWGVLLRGRGGLHNDFSTCFQIRNNVNKCATTLQRDRVTEAVLLPIFRLCSLDDLRIISCLENTSSNLQGNSTSNNEWTFETVMDWAFSQQ